MHSVKSGAKRRGYAAERAKTEQEKEKQKKKKKTQGQVAAETADRGGLLACRSRKMRARSSACLIAFLLGPGLLW